MKNLFISLLPLAFMACTSADSQISSSSEEASAPEPAASNTVQDGSLDTAIVAGGCFWCVESDFEKLTGVSEVVSGYTGGTTLNPTYKEVSYGGTGHYEAAEIFFDPAVITYRELIDYYWTTVDPTDATGQFCDKGESYRTAIFARPDQIETAKASLAQVKETKPFSEPIITPIKDAVPFYKAEGYHQDYYKKNSLKYKYYRSRCGRDAKLKDLWGTK